MRATTERARHVLFRVTDPARLPDGILGPLRDEIVLAGWMRASGILHDVRLKTATTTRQLTGTSHVIALEGSIGLAQGDVTCGLRAVLARETDTGLETVAGEIIDARVGDLEVLVIAFDEVTATRQPNAAGLSLLDTTGVTPQAPAAPRPPAPPAAASAPAPVAAPPPPAPVAAPPPAPSAPEPPKPSPTFTATAMPQRPAKAAMNFDEEQIYPDAGDVVEHFAFGRCEVVKSDGDRLHLRLGKDGRIKEIALEMLKVTPLSPVEGSSGKHFKLDRKL